GTEFLRRIISSLCLPVRCLSASVFAQAGTQTGLPADRQAFATLPLCAPGPDLALRQISL
ncbi:MAG: hypothetical protein JXA79_05445, partial [Deltaproteobacteria bacterium]|nr:hypothetical protein [Deltaproteobacteria bacterium]